MLYGLFNCCGNHDKTLNVIFRPLRVVVFKAWNFGFGDDIEPESRNRVMIGFHQVSIGKCRCLKVLVSFVCRPA